jgi:hypothetical protein
MITIFLPAERHQARTGWLGWPLDLRWRGVQLAATPPPGNLHAGRGSTRTHTDGSHTVWCSDHDPMNRLKGMHGVCLHPGKAYIELKVRLYNRTPFTQTFLWWANAAVPVHELYQSFFPPDVQRVADHARRAVSRFPLYDATMASITLGGLRHSRIATTTDVYMQEIPESVQKTVDAISAELRLLPNLEEVKLGTSILLPNVTKPKSGVSVNP